MSFASRFLSKSKQLCMAQNMIPKDRVIAVRHFAKDSKPAFTLPKVLKADVMLKGIFDEVKNKFEAAVSVFRQEKIIIDPDDPVAVKRYAEVMNLARQKAGIMSEVEKSDHIIKTETQGIPDVRGYFEKLREVRQKRNWPDELGIEAMQFEALEKVEKVIKKPLMRSDKKGVELLRAELDKGHQRFGVSVADLPKLEEQLDLKIAKAQLESLKKEMVDAMEAQKKKEEFKDEEMPDVKTLDVRNFL